MRKYQGSRKLNDETSRTSLPPDCRPRIRLLSSNGTAGVADAEQPTDNTEAATSADTLRLVIIDKSISRIDSVVQARIINPNDYDVNYGQEYAIERETDGHWQQVPFPKNFGFTSVLSTVAAHGSATVYGHIRLLHLTPGHYRLTKQIDGRTLSDDFFIRSGIKFPTEIYR